MYELPFGKGKKFLNQGIPSTILGGWQVNSIVSSTRGFPVHITNGGGGFRSGTALNANRPNAVLGVDSVLDDPSTNQYFNIQSVQLQPAGTFGNLARNAFRGPGVFDWDFSMLKNFTFTERTYLQFRFECFNCSNHPNWADPGSVVTANRTDANGIAIPGTGSFGVVQDTRPGITMRKLQFGLKLVF